MGSLAGLALTEGEPGARAGGARALHGDYRWPLGAWSTLGPFARIHGHLYDDGKAAFALIGTDLQFSGIWQE